MFKEMIERSWDILFMTDLLGNFTYMSPSSKRVLGCAPEEVVGSSFKKYISLTSIPKALAFFTKTLLTKEPSQTELQIVRTDNGNIADIEVSNTVIMKDGSVVGVQGVIRDITERNKIQNELKEKLLELEKINKLMVGRELKMAEIKAENEKLKK